MSAAPEPIVNASTTTRGVLAGLMTLRRGVYDGLDIAVLLATFVDPDAHISLQEAVERRLIFVYDVRFVAEDGVEAAERMVFVDPTVLKACGVRPDWYSGPALPLDPLNLTTNMQQSGAVHPPQA